MFCVRVCVCASCEYPNKYMCGCVCVPMRNYRQAERHTCIPVTVYMHALVLMHQPHKVTIVSNGGCAKTYEITVWMRGLKIQRYQIFSLVSKNGGSPFYPPCQLLIIIFPMNWQCFLDLLKDQKKRTHILPSRFS